MVIEFLQWLPGPPGQLSQKIAMAAGPTWFFRKPPISGDFCGRCRNSVVVARAIVAGCRKNSAVATGPPWFFADLLNPVIFAVVANSAVVNCQGHRGRPVVTKILQWPQGHRGFSQTSYIG